VTLDESEYCFPTNHELTLLQPGEEVPERERPAIQSEKMMLTIVGNPAVFHDISVLGKGLKFNATHYVTEILSPLAEWLKNQVGASDRKLIVHADRTRPHTAGISLTFLDENDMMKALHPPYPSDLVPSDFFPFVHVKQLLRGVKYPDRGSLFDAIVQILTGSRKWL
jgi:hypothetical protein